MSDEMERGAFGKPVQLPTVNWDLIREYTDYGEGELFRIENGDPNYQYLWPVANDPNTIRKIRRHIYQLVRRSDEDGKGLVTSASEDKDTQYFRINEHILVRMPKDVYENLQARSDLGAIGRERRLKEEFLEKGIAAGGKSAEPFYEVAQKGMTSTVWE